MTEEQRLADNEIYKRMWRILESKEAGNEIPEDDEEFFKSNLKKITTYYEKNFYKWKSVSKNNRVYDGEVFDFADVMTAEEWNEAVSQGCFNNDDGSGYWVKDGKECIEAEVFHSPQLDATHVAWYNK
jgi:hypothetical protein